MTRLTGGALRVTVFIGENDTWHHKPLCTEIVVVDTEERVRAFLPQLDELVAEGLVILDECEVIRYAGRADEPGEADAKGKRSL